MLELAPMHVPITIAAFALLTFCIVLLRLRWPLLSQRSRSAMILCACTIITAIVLSSITHWSLVSQRLHDVLLWAGIASYELLLALFTLMRPRWLTSLIFAILVLPLLSSSILLPLTDIFNDPVQTIAPLGDRLFSVRTIVDREPIATSAADLDIYYRPAWMPIFQRRAANVRFFDTQCVGSASFAVLQPDHRRVLLSCPPLPSEPLGTPPIGAVVPLR